MTVMDHETYLVRKPLYETGSGVKNRQSPGMTYISRAQVPEAGYYLTLGWIYGIPEPNPHIHQHVHDYDEIVLHIGGDPDNPEDLGADMEFGIGGHLLPFSTSTAAFIPKGIPHGPLKWNKVRKPHIEMAIMLGAGTLREGWGDSGIESPGSE